MEQEVTAPVLHVALQDGFENDTVVVRVNQQQVYSSENVSTDYRISLAASFDVPRPEGPVRVAVELPRRGLSNSIVVELSGTAHIAVSLLEAKIDFKVSDTPFGYL